MSFQQSHSLGFFSSNSLSSIHPVSPTQDIIPVPRLNYNQHRERPSRQLQSRQNSGRTHLLPGRSPSGSGGYNRYESSSEDTFILQIAHMATAEVLVQANNLAYINAIQHQRQAQTRLEDSIHERDRLLGEITGLRTAYNTLLTRLDSLSLAPPSAQAHLQIQGPSDSLLPITTLFKIPSVPIHVPLKRSDYPSVRYWDKKAFTDPFDNQKKAKSTAFSSSSSRLPDHEKILNTDYFEDENGQPVSKARICSAYEDARKIWNYFHDNGCAPVNYTDANRDHLQYFQHHLGISYPELHLGEGCWKFQYLWSSNYGSWKNKNTIKTRIKIEDTSESPDIAMTKATERPEGSITELLSDGSRSSKKRRMEEPEHSSNKKSKTAVSSRALEKRGDPLAGVKVAMLKTAAEEPEHPQNPVHDKAGSSSSVVIKEPIVATPPTGSELAPSDSHEDLDTPATVASAMSPLRLRSEVASTASINISPNAPPKKPDSKKVPTKKAPIVPPVTATDAGTKSSASVGEQSGAPSAKAATATKARKPKPKLYVVPAAINAKNVCGREWLSKNPGGSKNDYDTYYGNLTVAELNVFKKKSAELKKKCASS